MRFYLEAYHELGHGYQAHLHDPLAAAVALDPELVTTRPATVDIELTGTLTRAMTVTDWSRAVENLTRSSGSTWMRRPFSIGSSSGWGRSRLDWTDPVRADAHLPKSVARNDVTG